MTRQRVISPMINLALVALFLAGCNLPADTLLPTVTPIPLTLLPTATSTSTPVPSATPLPTATPTPTCNYEMSFVADVTIPDNTVILPGRGFVKTWRILNSSNCPWPAGTSWVFVDGNQMGGPSEVPVPVTDPGATVDVSMNLGAPNASGTYTGYWALRLPDGRILSGRIFARIMVPAPSPTSTSTSTSLPPQPLVILVDGAIENVVYHSETFAAGGTNADDIAEILADLPIETRKETTSLQWQREQQILEQNPALIIIHTSAFFEPGNSQEAATKFVAFLQYMQNARAKFLIYSRNPNFNDEVGTKRNFESDYPFLQGRVEVLYVPSRWDSDGVAKNLENKVKSILELN